ncbi:hypothetical protein STEG23_022772 [Scotinomys teguina]
MAVMLLPVIKSLSLLVRRKIARIIELQESIGKGKPYVCTNLMVLAVHLIDFSLKVIWHKGPKDTLLQKEAPCVSQSLQKSAINSDVPLSEQTGVE